MKIGSNSIHPFLNMVNISKSFLDVKALQEVNLSINENEIVGLVGENGAGKSTLVKILAGVYKADRGKISIDDKDIYINNPQDAKKHGIGIVFQEQSILKNMTVCENLFLGQEKFFLNLGVLSQERMLKEASEILAELDIDIMPTRNANTLNFIQREMIEIARNVWLARKSNARVPIILLDEPTTALEQDDIKFLFQKLNEIKKHTAIIFISHRLEEIVTLCDRVYILKDGKNVGCFNKDDISENLLRSKMVGKELVGEFYQSSMQRKAGEKVVLELKGCSKKHAFYNVSFQLKEGEILSICGTVGSGKEALCKAIFGIIKFDSGEVYIDGVDVKGHINSPMDAFNKGIGYIPEDRRNEGLILNLPLFENITLTVLKKLKSYGMVSRKKQFEVTEKMVKKTDIRSASITALCKNLSGGNQQKLVLGKWLLSGNKILVMSHPTRGVDVGAKQQIYTLMREMVNDGMSLITMGDSFEEDIGLANRIIIMKDGKIITIIDANESKPTPVDLIEYIV
ncbi:MAG: sugar ABC transporter ATP-binding protein [Bacteroidetes bacterium]|nr:sugar ABC transporter ATP-binding protein [Bacteroidota bacterium]